jgi:DtxR family Mn-dependent transcriptional regulator
MANNSQTEENYLKALYNLSSEKKGVNATDLAQHLEVSLPTVTSMVKRLSERNLVSYEKYKPLKLTSRGKKEAAEIIRKHRLTEMFLVERMGFGWEEVHMIAEQVEHIKSSVFFDRMDELLGFPRFDPHGSPIPDKEGNILNQNLIELSTCGAGDRVVLKALNNSSEDLLRFLNNKGLAIGTELVVLSKEAFDQSMTLSYAEHSVEVFSNKVCASLMVARQA